MKPVARLHIIKQREYRKRCRNRPRGNRPIIGNPSIGYNPNIGGSNIFILIEIQVIFQSV